MRSYSFYLFVLVILTTTLFAQEDSLQILEKEKKFKELKYNLSEDGKQYFKVTFLNQTWLRFNESNPGTTLYGESAPETFDIGLRRTRIQMFGQITERSFVYFQFGQNNVNRNYNVNNNRKVASFFHDALCEYRVTQNNALKFGGGLTIANGLSRFSQPSIGTVLTMDVPVFAQATVDQVDQFSRKLSLFARGQVWKLDYRFSLSDPFNISSNGQPVAPVSIVSSFAPDKHRLQRQGYVALQFFDHEGHTTPYMAGTYLGKKKIFNIAGGFIHQPQAMWNLKDDGTVNREDMVLFSVESFLDMPTGKEKFKAMNAYVGYFNYNFGKNYLRYNGVMNPATGTTNLNAIAGASWGSAFPMMGTGQIVYAQTGMLFEFKEKCPLFQPYMAYTLANFDRLKSAQSNVVELGFNLLFDEQRSKLSLNVQNRPTFEYDSFKNVKYGPRKNMVVMQYQISI